MGTAPQQLTPELHYFSMATTCKQAIANFEGNRIRNKKSEKADACTVVKLYFQTPPIAKLDAAALASLKACEHLWISYNLLTNLAGIEQCSKLKALLAGNCNISDPRELSRLQVLPSLEELVLHGNPLQAKIEADGGPTRWGEKALAVLPNLRRLDGIAAVSWRTKITEGNEVQLRELFDKMDADGSGGLDLNEVRNALEDQEIRRNSMISKEKADELFSNMDQGGTGNIDWDEFKRFFSTKRRPSAVNLGV